MDRYIEQLLEDFQHAAAQVPPPSDLYAHIRENDEGDLEDISYVEKYLYGTPQPLSQIVGIDKILLPPVEKLSGKQAAILEAGMEKLLNAYHFFPDFPHKVPARIKYHLLYQHWDSDQVFVGAGENHLEFCNYEPKDCPFPEQCCECLDIEKQLKGEDMDSNFEMGEGEPPF